MGSFFYFYVNWFIQATQPLVVFLSCISVPRLNPNCVFFRGGVGDCWFMSALAVVAKL